ncbi:ABC-2 type transport system permease protein [Chitinophaga niastensis]|uniref:ABC-2 type transport system permease protein n=1 Tax=Chitinophaga niastensis TaxID=536980 RepID=A0A2P8HPV8_CHINA|nr:ABC transporter permease [Chitinophaga niastensis]PSL48258.1 ABC-2 type transport system permease protein [Chitinophaga niastensis]
MRTIRFLLQKEFLQIFRSKAMLRIILIVPILQLLVLSYAANYEIKNIAIDVIDRDLSPWSQQLVSKILASGYFKLHRHTFSEQEALDDVAGDRADIILVIPPHFERDLVKENKAQLQLLVNAINGSKAGLANGYANSIIRDFNQQIRTSWLALDKHTGPARIEITYSNWYNQRMDYKVFMVPGILVVLVTLIGAFLSGMNIVKEKEIGTIEQLNVTPIRKYQFILGKLIPFWIIGMFELIFGLLVGKLVFDLPIVGSIGLVFLFAAIYLWVMLGMGLLVSTFTDTQQQAMFIAWFFVIIFMLMSGLFTPVESMPHWAQQLTLLNPIAYFIKVIRMVMLKGSGFSDISMYLLIMFVYALVMNGVAILNYRKRV